jgi:hypothetical protein
VAGFSGIAATILVAAYLTKTDDRSDGGEPSAVTSRNFVRIANQGTGFAGPDNGKPCSSGLMTAVRYSRWRHKVLVTAAVGVGFDGKARWLGRSISHRATYSAKPLGSSE